MRPILPAGLLGLVAALWTWTLPVDPSLRAEPASATVLVLDNGFHIDLAVRRAVLEGVPGPLAEAVRGLGPGDWVLIGWGDSRFYVDQRPITDRLPDGVRAFFRPGNASVLMLDPHRGDPRRGFPAGRTAAVPVSTQGMEALRSRVEATLQTPLRLSSARPGSGAHFYDARGDFWILNLCNTWAARTLNAAGVPVRPLRSVVSNEVLAAVGRADRGGAELDSRPSGA